MDVASIPIYTHTRSFHHDATLATISLNFIKQHWNVLLLGLVFSFWSAPGQTVFISLFTKYIQTDFGFSYGDFGMWYALASICSAMVFIPSGKYIDALSTRRACTFIVGGFAIAMLGFAINSAAWLFPITIMALRFFGQGMMVHISVIAMARAFQHRRGKALGIAAIGFPIAESIVPTILIVGLATIHWRNIWVIAMLCMLSTTLLAIALWPKNLAKIQQNEENTQIQHSRSQVIRTVRFWLVTGLVFTTSFCGTALMFFPYYFAQYKAVSIDQWVLGYPLYAGCGMLSNVIAGWLVDKIGAQRIAPFFILFISVAVLCMVYTTSAINLLWFFIMLGLAAGSQTAVNALLAELYGTKHLGSIRSVVHGIVVAASAMSPLLLGMMIDANMATTWILLPIWLLPMVACCAAIIALHGKGTSD